MTFKKFATMAAVTLITMAVANRVPMVGNVVNPKTVA